MIIKSAIAVLNSAFANIQPVYEWTILVRYANSELCFFTVAFSPLQKGELSVLKYLDKSKNADSLYLSKNEDVQYALATLHKIASSFKPIIQKEKFDKAVMGIMNGLVLDTDDILSALKTNRLPSDKDSDVVMPFVYDEILSHVRFAIRNFPSENLNDDKTKYQQKSIKIMGVGDLRISKHGGVAEFGEMDMQHQINKLKAAPSHRVVQLMGEIK